MNKPPVSKKNISTSEELVRALTPLVGSKFILTRATRTDGSMLRKLLAETLSSLNVPMANDADYTIVPPKGKGVPKLLRELVDSYIITSGKAYNLQVWNRNPSVNSLLVEYHDEREGIYTTDIRYIFTKVNVDTNLIESIVILTGDYIVERFGKFGVQTVKHQFLLPENERQQIYKKEAILEADTLTVQNLSSVNPDVSNMKFSEKFKPGKLFSMEELYEKLSHGLIGYKLDNQPTKNRGQALELLVANILGYDVSPDDDLDGGYPDIRNQLLEVKVQDSQTVDLGKYTPQDPEVLDSEYNITTLDIRYLIALTNKDTSEIQGILLVSGQELGTYGTFVPSQSFKCQRRIPMKFFEQFKNQVVFNP